VDRDELLAGHSRADAFRRAAAYEKKQMVEAFIGSILNAIERDGREPDEWEAHDIAAAIGYDAAGLYHAA
jgi:hypothetical protein